MKEKLIVEISNAMGIAEWCTAACRQQVQHHC